MSVPVVVAGPTASGKSALALALARALDGELVVADSRQVYAGMPIASAAPTDDELRAVPHHGYGAVDPTEPYDAGRFVDDTDRRVAEIAARGKTAILVGGTGLYLRAWRYGLADVPSSDPAVRAALDDEIARDGLAAVHARLAALDPESAARISPSDRVRVVRALEIHAVTGAAPSAQRRSFAFAAPRVAARWLRLSAAPAWLAPRIEARARAMFAHGLVDEARALRARLPAGHRLLETLGVKEALAVLDGRLTLAAAVAETATRTRQYARRQRIWFQREPFYAVLDAARPDLVDAARAALAGEPPT